MSLLFADSFDHYNTSQITRKWSAYSGVSINASAGRNSTAGLAGDTLSSGTHIRKATPSNPSRLIVGFAAKVASLPSGARPICSWEENGVTHAYLLLRTDGKIAAYRGGGTLLGTSSAGIGAAQYNYLEVDYTVDDSAGAVQVKLNGVSILNLSSQDTRNGQTGVINNFYCMGDGGITNASGNSGPAFDYIDDFYMLDTSGGTNNSFLGDVRVQAILPSGAGNYTQWTPSAGSNYQCVDENPATDDTDYNSSSTANQKDSFAFGDVTPTSGTVYGVCVNVVCRKDDAGSRSLRSLNRLSSTDANATAQTIGSSYANYQFVHETKPGGGSFSISDVNSSEFGYEITA